MDVNEFHAELVAAFGGTGPTNNVNTYRQSLVDAVSNYNKAAAQADSTAEDVEGLVADFNSLLAKLRTAGILDT